MTQLCVHGLADAKTLAGMLGLRWVPAGRPLPSPTSPVILWGPLGWALRTASAHQGRCVWRADRLALPLSANARWAARRLDSIVVGDELTADAIDAAGCGPVTVVERLIPPRGDTTRPPTVGAQAVSKIGAIARPGDDVLGVLLAVARLNLGALGKCSSCGRRTIGRLDPWTATIAAPACCGPVEALAPVAVSAAVRWRDGSPPAASVAHLMDWLGPLGTADLDAVIDDDAAREATAAWSAIVAVDDHPGASLATAIGRSAGVPTMDGRPVTRTLADGSVRTATDPVVLAHTLHRWLTDAAARRQAAADAIRERPDADEIRSAWASLLGSDP